MNPNSIALSTLSELLKAADEAILEFIMGADDNDMPPAAEIDEVVVIMCGAG